MNKYPLMGKYVQVKAYIEPRRNKFSPRSHYSIELKEPRTGMVVGYRTVYDGEIKGNEYGYEIDSPRYFVPTKSIKVLLVSFWPTYKPVLVKPEDIDDDEWEVNCNFNYYPTSCKWFDDQKEELREIMKTMPRDEKGRWTKT